MKIKLLNENGHVPTRGSEHAAGWDLYASQEQLIAPGRTAFVGTGTAVEIPEGYFGGIYARSGLACKSGLRPANCTGVIDSDYRGEIIVCLYNDSNVPRIVVEGERIAQLIIQPYSNQELEVVTELSDTTRGSGGFGSTGSK